MKSLFKRLSIDTLGATALEYGLILALLFIAVAGTVEGFADANGNIWNNVSSSMANAVAGSTP